jgi:hypothetical protein
VIVSGPRRASILLSIGLMALAACGSTDDGGSAATTEAVPASTTAPATSPAPTGPVTQPPQPTSGPGGSAYAHGDWRESHGGSGSDAWYVFEPTDPRPASAPVAIVLHGYFEYAGYAQMEELIRHTVRTGTIVIYPRWQVGVADPCPGPLDIEPCLTAARNGILGALAHLEADPTRVQPRLDEVSWFGFSFGGIITADLANRHEALGLPEPRAIFLDDPHDGGFAGRGEPALDDSLAGIPADVLFECHSGAEGVIAEPGNARSSCNAVFPELDHIADDDKDLVLTEPDHHGTPALSSGHGVCAAPRGHADAYDWGFCWKVWDALRSAALDGTDRGLALGDTPEHRSNGTWSDGVPIAPLHIQDEAPIRP